MQLQFLEFVELWTDTKTPRQLNYTYTRSRSSCKRHSNPQWILNIHQERQRHLVYRSRLDSTGRAEQQGNHGQNSMTHVAQATTIRYVGRSASFEGFCRLYRLTSLSY